MKKLPLFTAILLAAASPLPAATTWTNGGADSSWSNPANWSNGVPDSSPVGGAVIIGTTPTDNLLGIDTGVVPNHIYSLAITSPGTSLMFVAAGVEQLGVLTDVTVPSAMTVDFNLPFASVAGAAAALNYATGAGLNFNAGLTLGAVPITATGGGISLADDQPITIELASATAFGAIQGPATTSFGNADLQFHFGFAPAANTSLSLDLFGPSSGEFGSVTFVGNTLSGALTEMSPGSWSGTVGGQQWTFSESSGVLAVVPEPGCAALLACGGLIALRRRRSAA